MQAIRQAETHAGALLCPLSLARDLIERGRLCLLFADGHALAARNDWRVAVAGHARQRRSVVGFLGWLQGEYADEVSAAR